MSTKDFRNNIMWNMSKIEKNLSVIKDRQNPISLFFCQNFWKYKGWLMTEYG